MPERSHEQQIADAARIRQFLNDDAVRQAMIDVEHDFIEEMINAKTSEERAKAQGKVIAMRTMMTAITAVIDRGDHVAAQIAKLAKQQGLLS